MLFDDASDDFEAHAQGQHPLLQLPKKQLEDPSTLAQMMNSMRVLAGVPSASQNDISLDRKVPLQESILVDGDEKKFHDL